MNTIKNITFAQLQTLHEVSRKINSQLNLQKLLDEIMDLAVELLKAEKGLILFKNSANGEIEVQVARAIDKQALNSFIAMSRSIIEKVANEAKAVFLERFPGPKKKNAPKSFYEFDIMSVLCVPLQSRGQLIGVIYLDTTKPNHFFKKDDLFFLEAFANLAGIAVENAKSYQEVEKLNTNLEKLVDERTHELQQKHGELKDAYQDLKAAQLQLIRSEKMASLGMLVAGIAHEVNTPLGSIYSNNDVFLRCFKKLREDIETLLANSSTDTHRPGMIKALDTVENLAEVNKEACTRIMEIVKGLKNFSRLDEEEFKAVNIHEGIDSTLEIIQYLCENRIEIIKDYADLPHLRCKASQINQVFMNLFVNACQAIEGDGKIFIQTQLTDDTIDVAIKDTGVGIASENLEKVFDPGYTTKGVGVGTGLGLSIAYKIIEDHGGSIEVESELAKGSTFTIKLPLKN
ncbi:GAF domain-containing protein [candidate division KSB1 bacterium]|nr:GAF domain-containing protein [candidate division KSB1 bacterium]